MAGARLYDGKTAEAHEVVPTLDGGHLMIADPRGVIVAHWPLGDIVVLDRAAADRPLRLGSASRPDARLIIDDGALGETIAAAIRADGGARRRRRATARRWLIGLAATVGAAVLAVGAFPYAVRGAVALVPASWETRIGDAVIASLIEDLTGRANAKSPRCVAPEGRAALDALAARLAAVARAPYPFRIEVVEAEMVNALAVPGGRIVILSALIDQATSAEELAGVIAHEMGHGIERHPLQAAVRFLVLRSLAQALAGGESERVAAAAALWANFSYGREDERAADRHAARILERTGIGTQGLAGFFRRLAEREKDLPAWLTMLSSHPASETRAADLGDSPVRQPALTEREWSALKGICGK